MGVPAVPLFGAAAGGATASVPAPAPEKPKQKTVRTTAHAI